MDYAGWKKFEAVWNLLIKIGGLKHLLPVCEMLLKEDNDGKKSLKELYSVGAVMD